MIVGNGWAFCENPKAASSSIRKALSGYSLDYEKHCTFMSREIAAGCDVRAVVVRDPYDRVASGWTQNARKAEPLLNWLQGKPWECGVGLDFKRVPQTAWTWRCNWILRFETLADDWRAFCEEVGIEAVELPLENAGPGRPHYRELIGPVARALIEDRFAPDFLRYGYKWKDV